MDNRKVAIDEARFVRRCLIVLAIVVGAWVGYQLLDVLLLVFGAVLIAVICRAIADPLTRAGLPPGLALMVVVLALVALLGSIAWFFGSRIAAQAGVLGELLPEAWRSLEQRIRDTALGDRFLASLAQAGPDGMDIASRVGRFMGSVGKAAVDVVVVVVAGVFIAASPRLYLGGFEKLFPSARQHQVASTLRTSADALRRWLLGQLLAMLLVGLLTGFGLWLVGVPSAFALGLIAGLAEFVPIAGPFLSALPGLLLALAQGPEQAAGALLVYIVVQQVESNLITPLVARRVVLIPPAVTIFALLALGVIFGPIGILLAAPLTVVIFVAVQKLYVRETLQHETTVPGEQLPDGGRDA